MSLPARKSTPLIKLMAWSWMYGLYAVFRTPTDVPGAVFGYHWTALITFIDQLGLVTTVLHERKIDKNKKGNKNHKYCFNGFKRQWPTSFIDKLTQVTN